MIEPGRIVQTLEATDSSEEATTGGPIAPLRVYNTLTRAVEPVIPLHPVEVRMYTCGPTVYRSVHIGNLRSYLLADWLRRVLGMQGLRVKQVKNVTDVGHMRQELLERGEDKMIAAALAEGKTPAQIAAFYTAEWLADEAALHIMPATVTPRATEHIAEMVALIERLVARGHAYAAGGNVYFDVASFPAYGRLSGNLLDGLLEGVRSDVDPLKRRPADFTLWKAAEAGRAVQWDSPWGPGFPGWHIECSAMSIRYLGESFDLHTGGVDNVFPHHEDEIAQSEAATGRRFVSCWVHGQHLLADGLKMAKSTGNAYTLADLRARGFDPLAFRYLCLLTHYRARLNFTFASLRAAELALVRLRDRLRLWHALPSRAGDGAVQTWDQRFQAALLDDLNLPAAVGIMWSMLRRSALAPAQKRDLLLRWDEVLGLGLDVVQPLDQAALPEDTRYLLQLRAAARARGDYEQADALRLDIGEHGYGLRDNGPITLVHVQPPPMPPRYSRAADVPSLLEDRASCDVSVCLLVHNYRADLQRCLAGLVAAEGEHSVEYLIVENASTDDTAPWLEHLAHQSGQIRLLRADHRLGEAEGRNLALRQARGRVIVLIDTGVEATGDVFGPILTALEDPSVGVVGRWGLRTADMRHFEASEAREVDAIAGYLFAFRRADLRRTGWMDAKYRYYRNLDLHFGFQFRAIGLRLRCLSDLPAVMHAHRGWEELSEEERDKRSKRNFYRFLNAWHHREDLLVSRE
ncbi:MAG TPA: cysteine--tRNA ligase [Chloroflexota bacterium]|jgi:cysteinyl-tRNA synthetase|nr:cysteine--tRNA ligase [Chloroflexota bacterium]